MEGLRHNTGQDLVHCLQCVVQDAFGARHYDLHGNTKPQTSLQRHTVSQQALLHMEMAGKSSILSIPMADSHSSDNNE